MICCLRRLQVCGLGSCLFYKTAKDLRILKHWTWSEHIFIKWLIVMISLEDRALQCIQQGCIFDVAV